MKRIQLGFAKPNALWKYWTPKQERLLGTAPDRAIARRLKRTVGSVTSRRSALRIPAWRPG